jgi:hypothetical protein
VDLLSEDPAAEKWRPLELHHVEFYSKGGSDEPENLIPLCPTCHTIVHTTRTLGRIQLDDDTLRRLWDLWVSLDGLMPGLIHIGHGKSVARAVVDLTAYGIQCAFSADASASYGEARRAILANTVGLLALMDPHFPFPRSQALVGQWHLSTDPEPGVSVLTSRTAADAFQQLNSPLRLRAPVIVTLNNSPSPYLGGTDEQRTL